MGFELTDKHSSVMLGLFGQWQLYRRNMIIECPACNKRISNKYEICPHCHAATSEGTAGVPAEKVAARLKRERAYRMQMHTFASLLIAVAGFGWYWYQTQYVQNEAPFIATAMMVGGAAWYIVVRVWMVLARAKE